MKKMRPDNTKQAFASSEVVEITGVPYRTLDYWARTGLVIPSVAQACGTGSERLYDFPDLVALRVMRALSELGVSVPNKHKAMEVIRSQKDPMGKTRMLAVGTSAVWVNPMERAFDVVTESSEESFPFAVALVDYYQLAREVAAAVKMARP